MPPHSTSASTEKGRDFAAASVPETLAALRANRDSRGDGRSRTGAYANRPADRHHDQAFCLLSGETEGVVGEV
jgi:hypothetical protein